MKLFPGWISAFIIVLNVSYSVSGRNADLQRHRTDSVGRKGPSHRRRAQTDTWVREDKQRRRDRVESPYGDSYNERVDTRPKSKGKAQRRMHDSDLEGTRDLQRDNTKGKRKHNTWSEISDIVDDDVSIPDDTLSNQEEHPDQGRSNIPSSGVRSGHWCPPCDIRHCPVVSPETCQGTIRKDWCDCCPVCNTDPDLDLIQSQQAGPTIVATVPPTVSNTESSACEEVTCGKHEVCILNIQGIPMCRCPGAIYCKMGDRNPLCGEDGVTYKSRCYLKAAKCETGQNILVAHRGKCPGSKDQRLHEREERIQEKLRRKAERQEIKPKKMSKEDRKMQKFKIREEKREEKIRMREEKREEKKDAKKKKVPTATLR